MHGAFRADTLVRRFEGTFLRTDGQDWFFTGPDGPFTVAPTRIIWCLPRERPAPPEGWVLLRRAARHLAGDLFTNADRTAAYELLAGLASNMLRESEHNSRKPRRI